MQDIFRHLYVSKDLVSEFLAVFSRMEYALKSTEYAAGDTKRVEPAWDKFANKIDQQFMAIMRPEVATARDYLLCNPPRKQILKDKTITFIKQDIDDDQTKTQQVLLMIRTVRNNLFHGGKYCPEGEVEAGRNNLLVSHGLCILRSCSELDEKVKASFEY